MNQESTILPVTTPTSAETEDKCLSAEAEQKLEDMKRAATSLQYLNEDGSPKDAMPNKLEALPNLPGEFTDLPEAVQTWLKQELESLGPEKIMHHLAIQLVTNNRLMERIRAVDALIHTGNRKERRARAKQIAKKGVDLTMGL